MAISSSATGLRPGVCTSTTRPTNPYTGQIIYETDTGYLRVWDGSSWDYLSAKQDTAQGLPAGDKMGLELIKTVSVGSAVSTIVVSDVFSASFDNYRIVVNNVQGSAAGDFRFQLGSTTSGYYGSYYYDSYGGATGVARLNNGTYSWFSPISSSSLGGEQIMSAEVGSPYLSVRTTITGQGYGNGYFTWVGTMQASTTSYTSFTLYPGGGTLTGGTVSVYGYRK